MYTYTYIYTCIHIYICENDLIPAVTMIMTILVADVFFFLDELFHEVTSTSP